MKQLLEKGVINMQQIEIKNKETINKADKGLHIGVNYL